MPTLRETIQNRLTRLDTVPDAFNDRAKAYQEELFTYLLSLIDSLERRDGFIVINSANLSLISDIGANLERALQGQDYLNAVRGFLGEFDEQGRIITAYLEGEFAGFELSDLANQSLLVSRTNAANALLGQSLKTPILNPIEQTVIEAINSGAAYTDLVRALRTLSVGNDEVLGLLDRYAKQISYDAFAFADRSFTQVAVQDLDIQFYRYQGGIIKDTREFCQERNGKFFHFEEIESWAGLKWQGKIKETNEKSIFIYAGGYNCRHSFVPVSEVNIPKEVLLDAIAKGYYNPSEETRELLGLQL